MDGGGGMYQAGAGATVSTIAGIVEAANQKKLAKEQLKQAAKLRSDAKSVALEDLDPYTLAAIQQATGRANTGLPDVYQDQLNDQTAQNLRAITESSPDGAAAAAAITSVLNNANSNYNTQNAAAILANQNNLQGVTMNVGEKYRGLQLEQTRKKEDILAQAAALDAASTTNKYGATQTATRATASGAAMFAGSSGQGQSKDYAAPTTQGGTGKTDSNTQTVSTTSTPSNYDWSGKTSTSAIDGEAAYKTAPDATMGKTDSSGDTLSPEAIAAINAYYKKKGGGTTSTGFWK